MPILTPENEVLIRNMGSEEFLHYAELEQPGDLTIKRASQHINDLLQAEACPDEIDELETKISEKEDELDDALINLARAEADNEALRERIREMIENSGDGPIDKDKLLLEIAA